MMNGSTTEDDPRSQERTTRTRTMTDKGLSYAMDNTMRLANYALKKDDYEGMCFHVSRLRICIRDLEHVSDSVDLTEPVALTQKLEERIAAIEGQSHQVDVISSNQQHMLQKDDVKPSDQICTVEKKNYSPEYQATSKPRSNHEGKDHQKSVKSVHSDTSITRLKVKRMKLEQLEEIQRLDKEAIEAERWALEAKAKEMEVKAKKARLNAKNELLKAQIEVDIQEDQYLGSDDPGSEHEADNYKGKAYHAKKNIERTEPSPSRPVTSVNENLGHALLQAFDRLSITPDLGIRFAGSAKDKHTFVTFILKFKNAYGNRRGFSETEKLMKLSECVTGDAKLLVDRCILLGEDGYRSAMKKLEERYGQPEEVVDSLMKHLTQGPTLSITDNFGLVHLADEIESTSDILCKLTTDSGNEVDYTVLAESMGNITKILRRLPPAWRNSIIADSPRVKLDNIRKYMARKTRNLTSAIALACATTNTKSSQLSPGVNNDRPRRTMAMSTTTKEASLTEAKCDFCDGHHRLSECKAFRKIRPQERQNILRSNKLCFNCFGRHLASECAEKSRCDLACKWQSKHNALLHNTRPKTQSFSTDRLDGHGDSESDHDPVAQDDTSWQNVEPITESEPESEEISSTSNRSSNKLRPFFQIVPLVVTSPVTGISVKTFGCLDSMSTVHCADENLLDMLKLKSKLPITKTVISTVTGTREVETRLTSLKIRGVYGGATHLIKPVEFLPGSHLRKTHVPTPTELDSYEHLKFLMPHYKSLQLDQVSVLIGAGATGLHITRDARIPDDPDLPIAVKTDLGWCVFGGYGTSGASTASCVTSTAVERNLSAFPNGHLSMDLSKLWSIESNDLCNPGTGLSAEDRRAAGILEQSIRKTNNGQYEVSLLWKDGKPHLPNNRHVVERSLKQKRTRFLRDPEYLRRYKEQVDLYVSNGFARQVPADEPRPSPGKVWYVPHHAVKHARKPSLRLVFNCSAQHQGTSLNDSLLVGPDMINSLVGVLVRFRTGGRYAVSADVKSMYHCVRVPADQTSYLRWLWFEDGDPRGEVVELEMVVHLFGCLSSSACANYALQQCGLGASIAVRLQIERNFYVDDYMTSLASKEAARQTVDGVYSALRDGGFTLTKFCANDSDLLTNIPDGHKIANVDSDEKVIGASHDQIVPEQVTLGMHWNPNTDNFSFKVASMDLVCSKRGVLSAIARVVYDPCGLMAPVLVLPARLLFQELCRRGSDWDSPLTQNEEVFFRRWYERILDVGNVTIQRFTRPGHCHDSVATRELHFLSDASEKCYGSCCYLREVMTDGAVYCTLLYAKSRLAPLRKSLTLVRLELQAAYTSVLARNFILPQLDVDVDGVHYWIDSTAVLGYVSNDTKRYQVFVSNRVAQIREVSQTNEWHWLPTHLNTSDLLTRGLRDNEVFDDQHDWFRGPAFLRQAHLPEAFSETPPIHVPDNDPELRKTQQVLATQDEQTTNFTQDYLVKFADFHKMKLAVATLKKFIRYKVEKNKDLTFKISVADLSEAQTLIAKVAQRESFEQEIRLLAKSPNAKLPKSSPIRKLAPFIGSDGLLRVGGRLSAAQGSYEFRHPVILPRKHHVTQVLIREYHAAFGHASVKQVLNEMRMKYHVIGGRSAVHTVWSKCLQCRRQLSQPGEQFMSALPDTRLRPFEPPFTYCSVDLFGHYFVKVGRSSVKRWAAIFICHNSKAVHIEIVHSLDMSSFINALRRMCSRRGKPKRLLSDQGSNLRAADKEIREAVREWNEKNIEERLRQEGIEWDFSPATASHMNGLAERVIRSARSVLVHLIRQQNLSEENLLTLMVECEAILNNRPIAEYSPDPSDGRALTPAHLVQPRSEEVSLPPGLFQPDDNYTKRRWRQVQYLTNLFWNRLIKEAYQLYQKRQKWLSKTRNLRVGDLVLIVDQNLHRNDWRYGRITEVKTSMDGLVRSGVVKTSNGQCLNRPITKLCLLEALE